MNIIKLKIGYFADGIWAHEAFKLPTNDNRIKICFVCVRYDFEDKTLKELAKNIRI